MIRKCLRALVWLLAILSIASVSTAAMASDYSVSATRQGSNLYVDGKSSAIIQTSACYQYVYSDNATLRLDSAHSGSIIFSNGQSCRVTNVLVKADVSAGTYSLYVTSDLDDFTFTTDGQFAFETLGCYFYAYSAPGVLILSSPAIAGWSSGARLLVPSSYKDCTVYTVYQQRTGSTGGATPLPDLTVSAVASGSSALVGQKLYVSQTVSNIGAIAATLPSKSFFYFSTTPTLTAQSINSTYYCSIGALAAGAQAGCSGEIVLPADIAPGQYYVLAKADSEGVIVESDESNNVGATRSQVTISATSPSLVMIGKSGDGSGSVLASDGSINCGPTCSASPAGATQLSLNAVPSFGSLFTGWSGSCSGLGACIVGGGAGVTASFSKASSTLQMPWFTKVNGYLSRFALLNSSSSDATYSISVGTEVGNTVKLKAGKSNGTLPAGKQTVISVDDIVESFGSAQRGYALIALDVPLTAVTGIYNLVQPTTGSISNVTLLQTQSGASSGVLVAPWITTDSAYRGDLILTNVDTVDATVSLDYLAPMGGSVTAAKTSLIVPTGSQLVVDGATLATPLGANSFGIALKVVGSSGALIKGTYKVYNKATGAASSTELVTPPTASSSTTLVIPWFSTTAGYESRFVLTNRGLNPAGYTVTVMPEQGNTITTGTLTGTIPAGGQVTIPATSILKTTSGPPRASVVFDIAASADVIDGLYQIGSTATGALSNTLMSRPSQSGASATTLKLPWFSSAAGYVSRVVFMNRGNVAAPFTLEIYPEQGNAVTEQLLSNGIIPARSMLVVPVDTVIKGFTGATRASAIIKIQAPDGDVDALYNIVNPVSGAISNTLLTR